jgi:TorA maturation chaperone TorD
MDKPRLERYLEEMKKHENSAILATLADIIEAILAEPEMTKKEWEELGKRKGFI